MKRKILSSQLSVVSYHRIQDAGYRMRDIRSVHRSPLTLHLLAFIFLISANTALNGQSHVIAHLNEKLPAAGNIIYCSSFEHAWKELSDNVLNDEVRLQKPISLQGNLNHSCKTAAYSPNYMSDSRITENGDSIICTSSFQEQLEWPVEFQSFGHPMRFYTGADEHTRCEYFGIHLNDQEELLKYNAQVKVVDFVDEGEFILKLDARCRIPDTGYRMKEEWGKREMSMRFIATRTEYGWVEIIIANVPREKTMLATIESVEKRLNHSNYSYRELIPDDILAIPKINLDLNKEYSELLGKFLVNKGFEEYFFAQAEQNINFEMDEQGARAGSDVTIMLKKGPSARRMVMDGPFLVYLKEYGAERPYLAVWIDNTEWLVLSD